MHLNLVLCLSVCGLCSAFFLFKEKKKPLIFCSKICPLYCPKHSSSKRYDHDSSLLIYVDHKPYIAADALHKYGHHSSHPWKSNPTPKSTIALTSEKPTHSEHSPHFIEEGSGEYVYHPPSGYYEDWEPKPTQKPTVVTTSTTTTESPIHFDHHPYIIEDGPDYEYPPHFHKHWGPQPTKSTTTSTTTTEQPYLDHPYFVEDWPGYHHAPHYYEWPHPTTSTTAAPTTTKEPTYICELCAEKCDHKS